MHRTLVLGIGSVVLVLLAVRLPAQQASGEGVKCHLEDLSWMVGGFEATRGKLHIEEHWIPAAGKSMLGVSRTIQNDRMVFFEFLRLEERADGIYYIAHPKASPGTEFKMTQCTENSATFENPQHDNPKIIRYRRESDDSLVAETEGDENGKHVVQKFPYHPVEKD